MPLPALRRPRDGPIRPRRPYEPAVKAPRGTPGRARSAPDKYDALLRAAIKVFAGRGFFGAQVADVARAAGVAAGTVYLYFQSKDDLLVSIFDRTMDEASAACRAAFLGVDDPIERLRRLARLHLERLGRDRDLAVVFQVELRQSTKFMERFSASKFADYLGVIRANIEEGQRRGVIRRTINPTIAAKVFFGALDEMATNWILSRRKYELASMADPVVDLLFDGMRAPEPWPAGNGPASRNRVPTTSRHPTVPATEKDTSL